MRPFVSVLIATYNQAATLAETLASLTAQNLPSSQLEIIVVNDGSTDETGRILRAYSGIRVIETLNRGLVASCNEGLAAAQGELFTRIDSDDLADPYWLSKLSELLDREPAAVCATSDRYELVGAEKTWVQVEPGNLYHLTACGTMFRTGALRKVGGFRPFFWEEYDLYLRLKPLGKFLHLPEPLYTYRHHPGGMTQNAANRLQGWKELAQTWGKEKLLAAGSHPELAHV